MDLSGTVIQILNDPNIVMGSAFAYNAIFDSNGKFEFLKSNFLKNPIWRLLCMSVKGCIAAGVVSFIIRVIPANSLFIIPIALFVSILYKLSTNLEPKKKSSNITTIKKINIPISEFNIVYTNTNGETRTIYGKNVDEEGNETFRKIDVTIDMEKFNKGEFFKIREYIDMSNDNSNDNSNNDQDLVVDENENQDLVVDENDTEYNDN